MVIALAEMLFCARVTTNTARKPKQKIGESASIGEKNMLLKLMTSVLAVRLYEHMFAVAISNGKLI
jgi:hypothetical protein